MFKKFKYFMVVDSVENAIKFYAEKLLFAVTYVSVEGGTNPYVNYAELRRGKCFLVLRTPALTELAEFSMVRRLNNRAAGLFLEVKKGFIQKIFATCKKKKLNILSELSRHPAGYIYFQLIDPFGTKIYIYEFEGVSFDKKLYSSAFVGYKMTPELWEDLKKPVPPQAILDHLRKFGMSRRIAKRFVKNYMGKKDSDMEEDGDEAE